ncbi:SRPBCC family protein [Kocuria sp.]|uniref:SRPBCC family protein n=1 Tax=Kocuria sp. TaxID=1871328 RepID=UPI0026DC8B28|nr:SRPBCC family protein [Kocuria sp.]MDO4919232.1 SRPBCC family protein [Kocuria sp.]
MEMTVSRTGPAAPQDVWRHYRQLALWTRWAPHLTRVRADSSVLLPGIEGTVTALGLVRARFRVLDVAEDQRQWAWAVRLGPVRLLLEHHVTPVPGGGSRADVRIQGPAPVLVAYEPVMGWALSRLVRVGRRD